jgi:signal transduction histidine kinase/CheY-like chemotaxis protein
MHAHFFKSTLEKYYERVYGGPAALRATSVLLVGALSAYLHVMTPVWALLWAISYICGEVGLGVWWRRIQPGLDEASEARIIGYHKQLVLISAYMSNIAAVPNLMAITGSHDAQTVAIVVCTGSIMILAAQHSLNAVMFFATAPLLAVALILNLYCLGGATNGGLFAILGVFFVLNAYVLQRANLTSFTDVVRVQLEADSANKTKSAFLASMSHEIRTPLNGVLGMAQAMALDRLDPPQRDRLNVIKSSGEALLALLNDLLDFSKIEAGKVELEVIPMAPIEILESACRTFEPLAREKGVALKVDLSGAAGRYLGDPTRIRQITQNLVSNGLKFTEHGEVRVTALIADGRLVVEVRDTGIGMNARSLDRLFGEFAQGDATTTRRFGGTGLGLTISRSLARLMGGDVTVQSQLGRGSTFRLDIPLAAVDSTLDEVAARQPTDAALAQSVGRLKVLVAEDNASNRLVLQNLLVHTGADCTYVENGLKALDAWEPGLWDLILMDIQMPVMDGMEATRRIRARETELGAPRTVIYAFTADAMNHQAAEHLAAGVDGQISKPVQVPILFGLLDEVARRKESEPAHTPRLRSVG